MKKERERRAILEGDASLNRVIGEGPTKKVIMRKKF